MKFRKKPVVIEAVQFTSAEAGPGLAVWCHGEYTDAVGDYPTSIAIMTKEGTMYARLGDWIIKGVAGEFYPCKPDIFDASYEAATEPEFIDVWHKPGPDA